jgi:predicted transposase YbfD/YdcC
VVQSATTCFGGSDQWSLLSSCGVSSVVVVTGLLDRFAEVGDPRRTGWVDHPVAAVLALCAGAVVAGMRSFTAIAGWVADVPAALLAAVYARCGGDSPRLRARLRAPSKGTIWRVVTGVDAAAVDAAIGAWLLDRASENDGENDGVQACASDGLVALSVDGKTVRGAKDAEGNQVHLLAAMTHQQGLVVAQTEVGAKTNEIPMLPVLLDGVDITGMVILADALHTQRATATYLHQRGAEFCFCVKENQPTLFAALDTLPWTATPIAYRQVDRGHGRITTRTIQVLPAPEDLPFPYVEQVFLIERYIHNLDGTLASAAAALGITSLTSGRASGEHLAGLVRHHWGIESLHWLRDTLYREDHSTIRTRSGPRIMAALRNLAIGAHRLAGRTDITEATRWANRRPDRPFTILGITT